jgi:hypothetical protein
MWKAHAESDKKITLVMLNDAMRGGDGSFYLASKKEALQCDASTSSLRHNTTTTHTSTIRDEKTEG